MRVFATALAAGAALLLGASVALASHAISPERYAALDSVYLAVIPFDREVVPSSAYSAARRACEGLVSTDPPLGALRPQCFDVVRLAQRTERFGRCRGRRDCIRTSRRLRAAISAYLHHTATANRAIDASVSDPACRKALRTSAEEVSSAKRMRLALRLLERGLRRRSRSDLRRALRRVSAIGGPSAKLQRERFRGACS